MKTSQLIPSVESAQTAEVFNSTADRQQPPASDLTPRQSKEYAQQAHAKVEKLIWHDKSQGLLDGKTLPDAWSIPTDESGDQGTRKVDASPWIDIEVLDGGRTVQAQLQTWRDQVNHYGENDELLTFASTERWPIPSIWLRVRDADDHVTDPEETFRFPSTEVVFFREEPMPYNSHLWEVTGKLIAAFEAWRVTA